jgi:hypothetical protein
MILTNVSYLDETVKVSFLRVAPDGWLIISDSISLEVTTEQLRREIAGALCEPFWDEYGWEPQVDGIRVVRAQVLDYYVWMLWTTTPTDQ